MLTAHQIVSRDLVPAERIAGPRRRGKPLACEGWNKRMLGFQGPAQPSPALGDALNAGFAISK